MTVGIELRRASDTALVLSNNIRNPIVAAQGTVTTGASPTAGGFGSAATVSSTGKIKAIKSAQPCMRWQDNVWLFDSATGINHSYYNFSDVGPDFTNVGLEIYADAVGSPIQFATHPNNKPLRVIDVVHSVAHGPGPGASEPAVADYSALTSAGRQLALAQGLYSGGLIWENGAINTGTGFSDPLYWAQINHARTFYIDAGGILRANWLQTDPDVSNFFGDGPHASAPGSNTWYEACEILVIDVTGY